MYKYIHILHLFAHSHFRFCILCLLNSIKASRNKNVQLENISIEVNTFYFVALQRRYNFQQCEHNNRKRSLDKSKPHNFCKMTDLDLWFLLVFLS